MKKKKKTNPALYTFPKRCFVKDSAGFAYAYRKPSEEEHEILMTFAGGTIPTIFESHHRASSAIHHTTEWLKAKDIPFSRADFVVVDMSEEAR